MLLAELESGRDYRQLRLELEWGPVPWNGWCPRMLTSSGKACRLPEAARRDALLRSPHQLCISIGDSFGS